ncbi:MAG TPA: cytochrome c3 family protein [Steroidobacteraceae bacterium]
MTRGSRLGIALSGLLALLGVAYAFLMWEGASSRAEAPRLESVVAQWLLARTVPTSERQRVSPLAANATAADIAAGQALYRQKCDICHAYNGSGKTEIGAGQYPRPPDLRSATIQHLTDGELLFHITNGIRHTGMPAWNLEQRQGWQLVSYIRELPKLGVTPPAAAARAPDLSGAHYAGSNACRDCHREIYDRWQQTRMANVVRDPREHPDAILPDLTKADPLVTFTKNDIAFAYGSRWKQRYFKKVGDDYYPLPAQWDVTHRHWAPYFVKSGTDWWASLYPPENMQRPTGPLCDGCHSVGYDIATKKVAEWNVGCERCHGPGSEHVAQGHGNIINPAKLDSVQANDVCIQCHSQGRPLNNPIAGKYYDWPTGFEVGKRLADFWALEEHKLGVESFTHFADGTAHKNRMQGNDFVQSLMYTRGVTCFSCHDVHGTAYDGLVRKPGSQVCLDCHGPNTPNGPRAGSIEAHTHHKAGSPGSECAACHMPKIQQTIADVKVHAHTFKFITPTQTDSLSVPNPCNVCHTDKDTRWTLATLKSWGDRSPWRMSD